MTEALRRAFELAHRQPEEEQEVIAQLIQEYLYHAGITERIPTNEPDTQEDEAEQKYLAHLFGQGKPASEMVIEDRGPY